VPVGRNGSGKSTLLKIAAGMIEATRANASSIRATVRYLPQEPDLPASPRRSAMSRPASAGRSRLPCALYLFERTGLTGTENPATLSGGRHAARPGAVLAPEPDILCLLDDPTNHSICPRSMAGKEIGSLRSALVLISHDRRFLENLSRATVWLDRRQDSADRSRGFAFFEEWRDQVLEEEERDRQKLDRKIVAEEHWVRYGVTARRKRNVRRMANLAILRQDRRTPGASPAWSR